jgi:3-hydroxy acid dehydrogenase/malonic semialdehyde reductase
VDPGPDELACDLVSCIHEKHVVRLVAYVGYLSIKRAVRVLITAVELPIGSRLVDKFVSAGHEVIASGSCSAVLATLHQAFSSKVQTIHVPYPISRAILSKELGRLSPPGHEIDVLINNATRSLDDGPIFQAPIPDLEAMMDTNCYGLVAMTREVLPGMLAKRAGTILNLSAAKEAFPAKGNAVFDSTVAFVHQYTLSLMEDLVNSGVRVSCIAPDRNDRTALLDASKSANDVSGDITKSRFISMDHDFIETTYWLSTLPSHVNLNFMELSSTGELFSTKPVGPH